MIFLLLVAVALSYIATDSPNFVAVREAPILGLKSFDVNQFRKIRGCFSAAAAGRYPEVNCVICHTAE
jgi:hypothetical protein